MRGSTTQTSMEGPPALPLVKAAAAGTCVPARSTPVSSSASPACAFCCGCSKKRGHHRLSGTKAPSRPPPPWMYLARRRLRAGRGWALQALEVVLAARYEHGAHAARARRRMVCDPPGRRPVRRTLVICVCNGGMELLYRHALICSLCVVCVMLAEPCLHAVAEFASDLTAWGLGGEGGHASLAGRESFAGAQHMPYGSFR